MDRTVFTGVMYGWKKAERVIVENRTVNNRNTDMGKQRNTPDGMALKSRLHIA